MNKSTLQKICHPVVLSSLVLVIIGLVMLKYRWINPDEGAHLADAKLLLAGKIPYVDYTARQPFYIFLLALCLKIGGMHYVSGRLLILFSSVAVSILIYLISKKLFNREVAITSNIMYVFLPFTILFSSTTKMNNVVTLCGCLGIFLFLMYYDNKKLYHLFLSGMVLGLAYYVRESSLAVLITILIMIILNGRKISQTLVQIVMYMTGFLFIVCLVFLFYINYLTLTEFWNSSLNPMYLPLQGFFKIISFFKANTSYAVQEHIRIPGQDITRSAREVTEMIRMNLYLIVGLVGYLIYVVKDFVRSVKQDRQKNILRLILPVWFIMSYVVYGYFYYARGFFAEYAIELFPPLIICLGYLFVDKIHVNKKNFFCHLLTLVAFAYSVFFVQKFITLNIELRAYFILIWSITIFLLVLKSIKLLVTYKLLYILLLLILLNLVLWSSIAAKPVLILLVVTAIVVSSVTAGIIGKGEIFKKLILIPALMTTLIFSFSIASRYLSISYNAVWSPDTVNRVDRFLTEDSQHEATLLSGGMIWALNAKIQPFYNITHPIAFLSDSDLTLKNEIEREIKKNSPTYIVMDGFTNRCYSFIHSLLKGMIQRHYIEKQRIMGERQVIIIYKLKDNEHIIHSF